MYKKLRMTEDERNKDQVYVIKKELDNTFKIEDKKKLILLNGFFTLINQINQEKD